MLHDDGSSVWRGPYSLDMPWFGEGFDVGPDAENVASFGASVKDGNGWCLSAHKDLGVERSLCL